MNDKNKFSGKIGFILAAAGSAVGLGNLWRFPYLAAKYGGGTFLLIYLILAATFGFALMVTEIAIGRKTGMSVVNAYGALNEKFKFLGYLSAAVPIIIYSYYSVIGGWVIKYLSVYLMNESVEATNDKYFEIFTSGTFQPIIFLFIFVMATTVIVAFGVQKGIEKFSKILMPILVILSVGVAIYGTTVPGAMEGVKYYLMPDFSKFSFNAVLAALGQLFYSMSLAMGIMITYGSYMKREDNIESCVRQIEIFDTGIAFLSGFIIVPAVFAFSGGKQSVLESGPKLMFITLPKVFVSMKFGEVIGGVFFILVFFAALTSAVSIMETIVSAVKEKTGLNRIKVCIIVALFTIVLAMPSTLGNGLWSDFKIIGLSILDFFDFVSNSVIMPIVALLTCIFVGYVLKTDVIAEEVSQSEKFNSRKLYDIVIKFVAPAGLVLILISSILNTFGVLTL